MRKRRKEKSPWGPWKQMRAAEYGKYCTCHWCRKWAQGYRWWRLAKGCPVREIEFSRTGPRKAPR